MALIKLRWVILLLLVGILDQTVGDDDDDDDDDDIIILPRSTYKCEDTEPVIELDVDLHNINDAGDKVLNLEVDFDDPFTADWVFNLKIDMWNNGDWDEEYYIAEGPVCQIVTTYASRAWKNLRNLISPAMSEACNVDPGHYSLSDFEVQPSDYDIPVKLVGRYRVTGRVFDESGTEMACQVIEVECDKK